MSTDNFRSIYEPLVMEVSRRGHRELNARTGAYIRVGEPTSFNLDLRDGKLPVCGIRKTYPKSAAAEVAWFLKGDQDVGFIRQYAPLWDKFVEEDGHTVAGAYGYRWRKHFGRDQIDCAINALIANPSDRRIYISAWDPAADGLGQPSKNVPCPVGFTLSLTDGYLNSTLVIRSSDIFVGLPYDVMGHALLMRAIQMSLMNRNAGSDVRLGTMQVTLAHPHFYEVHTQMLDEALAGAPSDSTIMMPTFSVDGIIAYPHLYVEDIAFKASDIIQPKYSCRPEVVV